MPASRLNRLLTVPVLALGLSLATGPQSVAAGEQFLDTAQSVSSDRVAGEVAALNAEIDRVGRLLADGAAAYETQQRRVHALTQRAFAARDDREALEDAAAASQGRFDRLARAAYKGGVPPMITALLSGDPRMVSELAYVQRSIDRAGTGQSDAVRTLEAQEAGAELTMAEYDRLRRQAVQDKQALDAQQQALAAQAGALSAQLQAAADRLEQARASERAAAAAREQAVAQQRAAQQAADRARQALPGPGLQHDGSTGPDGCGPPSSSGEVNGFLSPAGLCPLAVGRGHRLRTDAARAFDAMSRERQQVSGAPLCVTDSYRSYPAQVDVFRRKPALAATPGRSQHGWGLAVDLCGGVERFGTEAHEWMRQNAGQFGFVHPSWAQRGGSRPEPWHWEYVPAER